MNKIIYLDMDGVLVDFDRATFNVTGYHWGELPAEQIWHLLEENSPDIYRTVPVLFGAEKFVDEVITFSEDIGWNIAILTAIPRRGSFPFADCQKYEWIQENLPQLKSMEFRIGPYSCDKKNHAFPGDVLIDDYERNIIEWNEAGGVGIHHIDHIKTIHTLFQYGISVLRRGAD